MLKDYMQQQSGLSECRALAKFGCHIEHGALAYNGGLGLSLIHI